MVIPWQMTKIIPSPLQTIKSLTKSTTTTKEESVPLLENRPRTSINGFSGYS